MMRLTVVNQSKKDWIGAVAMHQAVKRDAVVTVDV